MLTIRMFNVPSAEPDEESKIIQSAPQDFVWIYSALNMILPSQDMDEYRGSADSLTEVPPLMNRIL